MRPDPLSPLPELGRRSHTEMLAELRSLLDDDRLFLSSGGDGAGGSGGDGDGEQASDGAPGGDGAGDGDGANGDALTPEQARKLRSEAKNLRSRLKDAEAKLSKLESRDLSDQQRLERERDEERTRREQLEAQTRELRAQVAATSAGIRANAARAAAALIDWEDVDADDPKALERAFKALKTDHDYLFEGSSSTRSDADGGRRGERLPADDMNARIRLAAGRA